MVNNNNSTKMIYNMFCSIIKYNSGLTQNDGVQNLCTSKIHLRVSKKLTWMHIIMLYLCQMQWKVKCLLWYIWWTIMHGPYLPDFKIEWSFYQWNFILAPAQVSSSGLAATSMIIQTLKSGDHIVAMNNLYGGELCIPKHCTIITYILFSVL